MGRPKIETSTLSRERSSSTSSTMPSKLWNGAVGDAHLLADLERDRRLGMIHPFLHLLQDRHRLALGDRHRLVAGAEETRDLRRVLDEVIGLIGHVHLHEHIAREELALGIDLAAAAHLDDLFGRHDHVLEQLLELVLRDLLANVLGDLALEVAVRLNDIPALGHAAFRSPNPSRPLSGSRRTQLHDDRR